MADDKRRRGHHEGSVFVRKRRRKDGTEITRYGFAVSVDGHRIQRIFDTRPERDRELARVLSGQSRIASNTPLATYLELWLREVVEPRKRPSTYEHYALYVNHYIVPALGKVRLDKLTPAHVDSFLAATKKAGEVSPRTVNHIRAVLRNALNVAVKREIIYRNVAALADPFEVPDVEKRRLSIEEARKLLVAIRGHRFETLYVLGLVTGLRQGELLGLKWETDIDLAKGLLTVRHQLRRQRVGDHREYEIVELKRLTSRRVIPLPAQLVDMLRAHQKAQIADQLKAGQEWDGSWGLAFTTALGKPVHTAVVTHEFQYAARGAGMGHMRFHDLRGSAASFHVALGIHPRISMAILGHRQIATTMEEYAEALGTDVAQAMEQMGGLLLG